MVHTPRSYRVLFAAASLVAVSLSGCVSRFHCLTCGEQVGQGVHSDYYHCPTTGRVIMKGQACCPTCAEWPCYGFQPTCWRAWPQECERCPPPGEPCLNAPPEAMYSPLPSLPAGEVPQAPVAPAQNILQEPTPAPPAPAPAPVPAPQPVPVDPAPAPPKGAAAIPANPISGSVVLPFTQPPVAPPLPVLPPSVVGPPAGLLTSPAAPPEFSAPAGTLPPLVPLAPPPAASPNAAPAGTRPSAPAGSGDRETGVYRQSIPLSQTPAAANSEPSEITFADETPANEPVEARAPLATAQPTRDETPASMPVANEPPNTHEATPEIRGPELLAPRRVPLAEGRQVSTNPSFVITRLWPLCDASELERYARASGRPGSNWSVAVEAVASVVAPTVTVQAAASPIPSENTFAPTSSEPLAVAAEDSQPVPDESASAPIAVVALQPAPVAAPVMPSASFTVLRVEEGGATAEAAAPAVLPATVVPSGARIRVAEPMPMPVDETAAAPVPNAAQAITTVAARAHRKAVIHLVAEPTQPSETQLR